MDIKIEKEKLIKRFEQVENEEIIQAVKDLLDFNADNSNSALESALDNALKQSKTRKVRPHHEVITEIRNRFA